MDYDKLLKELNQCKNADEKTEMLLNLIVELHDDKQAESEDIYDRLSQNDTEIEHLNDRITDMDMDIAAVQGAAEDAGDSAEEASNELSTLESTVSSLESDVEDLRDHVHDLILLGDDNE